MIGDGLALRRLVALPFLGHHMQQARPRHGLHVVQGADQVFDVVTVNGANVVEAQLLEQGAGHHHALRVLLPAPQQLLQLRQAAQGGLAALAHAGVELAGEQPRQVAADGPHRRRDGHVVVVEDHHQIRVQGTGVIEGLEGHARTQGPVADHRDHVSRLALGLGGHGHTQCCADGGAGVADAEGVVGALAALGESRQPAFLTHAAHAGTPAGEYLVRIGLVAHVPDQPVLRGVEDIVQGDGKVHHSQPRRQVTAGTGDAVDEEAAQLLRQLGKPVFGQPAKVGGKLDSGQERVAFVAGAGIAGLAVGHAGNRY